MKLCHLGAFVSVTVTAGLIWRAGHSWKIETKHPAPVGSAQVSATPATEIRNFQENKPFETRLRSLLAGVGSDPGRVPLENLIREWWQADSRGFSQFLMTMEFDQTSQPSLEWEMLKPALAGFFGGLQPAGTGEQAWREALVTFVRMYSRMIPEEACDWVLSNFPGELPPGLPELIMEQAAAVGFSTALDVFGRAGSSGTRSGATAELARILGQNAPSKTAWGWATSLSGEMERSIAVESVLSAISDRSPVAAAGLLRGHAEALTARMAEQPGHPRAHPPQRPGMGGHRQQRTADKGQGDNDGNNRLSRLEPVASHVARQQAVLEPDSSTAWMEALPTEELQHAAYEGYLTGLGSHSPADAYRLYIEQGVRSEQLAGAIFTSWAVINPLEASNSWQGLPERQDRIAAVTGLATAWQEADPGAAAVWLEALPPGEVQDAAFLASAGVLLDSNPAEAWAIASRIGEADRKVRSFRGIFPYLLAQDPAQALHLLGTANLAIEDRAPLERQFEGATLKVRPGQSPR